MEDLTRSAHRQAHWVVALFVADFCLQRVAVPGLGITATVPVTVLWLAAGLLRKVLEIDLVRGTVWLLAGGVTALLAVLQILFTPFPLISLTSWAFWMTVWLPAAVRFVDRSPEAHRRALEGLADAGLVLATLAVLFLLLQVVGVPYRDLFADIVPAPLVLQGYVTTYPITYGSPLFKPNAWLALEPSFLSFMVGVSLVAAIITHRSLLKVSWLFIGLLVTTAGSGLAVLAVFVAVTIVIGRAGRLLRYGIPAIVISLVVATTALGPYLLGRMTELGQPRSSASLRLADPYRQLLPDWTASPVIMAIGRGAGSSQRLVSDRAITGLLVPTPAKLLFDYGIIGGGLLLVLVVVVYLRTATPALAAALATSMLTLQSASQPLVLCSFLAISLYAPATRSSVPLEGVRRPYGRWPSSPAQHAPARP